MTSFQLNCIDVVRNTLGAYAVEYSEEEHSDTFAEHFEPTGKGARYMEVTFAHMGHSFIVDVYGDQANFQIDGNWETRCEKWDYPNLEALLADFIARLRAHLLYLAQESDPAKQAIFIKCKANVA